MSFTLTHLVRRRTIEGPETGAKQGRMEMNHKSILFVAAGSAIAAIGLMPAAASAGPPAVRGCVGASVSAVAANQPSPGFYGATIRTFAQQEGTTHPGLGDGVQEFQSGLVPDDIYPNICNVD